MANKVKFGLCNVHVFPITKEDAESISYGEVIKVPGAVNISLKAEGSTDPFFADNGAYYVTSANNGYSGTLEIALIPDEFYEKILNQKKDIETGILTETSIDKNTPFAMAFQFEGDESATRHILYRCTATRPEVSGETIADKVSPKTETLEFKATPRLHDKVVKRKVIETGSAYKNFFTKPYEKNLEE